MSPPAGVCERYSCVHSSGGYLYHGMFLARTRKAALRFAKKSLTSVGIERAWCLPGSGFVIVEFIPTVRFEIFGRLP